ncbi:MAG: ATP-binding protein [Boseongicola sp.]|nr:ATP-binding protein [Boseongicola sp.]
MNIMATREQQILAGFAPVTFEADSALLRELGERLVGQPHIALAELIKNAYDADATECVVSITNDEISVVDNGHGMTEPEFLDYWMTIGTTNKQERTESRYFGRNVTGSKGVGRLSAQFLAHRLEILTAPKSNPTQQLRAHVNWDEAIDAGKLTEAEAYYKTEPRDLSFPMEKPHGTRVTMVNLKQAWNPDRIRNLGRQLWMIQSPIPRYGKLATEETDPGDFRIKLNSTLPGIENTFERQMKAALQNYIAIISGELKRDGDKTKAFVTVLFRSGERYSEGFDTDPLIGAAKWQIRVFKLSGRQGGGIDVTTAREYFSRFGGVQVYDAGFRLPYYGVEQDWLGIEYDHSHRKNRSALLPERLQVRRALNDLPTQGRLFGVVLIDTGRESRAAADLQKETGEFLKIQVTRDRLVANETYQSLRNAVRWSLDYYATRQRLKEQRRVEIIRPKESPDEKLSRVRSLVNEIRSAYPDDDAVIALEEEVEGIARTFDKEREAEEAARSLLGPLASAGMAALAMEHESRKEMRRARQLLRRLRRLGKDIEEPRVHEIADQVGEWVKRVEGARKVFAPLLESDDRDEIEALVAADVVDQVLANVRPLLPGMNMTARIPRDLFLPAATFAEWNSLFQNVLINASNATLDLAERKVRCTGGRTGRATWIRVEDNGVGVEYEDSEHLFEPFARQLSISEERRALGLGGMGLGLTIVRMIASQRRVKVRFVEPTPGWSTAFQLSWGSGQ